MAPENKKQASPSTAISQKAAQTRNARRMDGIAFLTAATKTCATAALP